MTCFSAVLKILELFFQFLILIEFLFKLLGIKYKISLLSR